MNARNDVEKPSDLSLDARTALAAVRLRLAARVDFLVARWLERRVSNIEAAQGLFESDRTLTRGFGREFSGVVR